MIDKMPAAVISNRKYFLRFIFSERTNIIYFETLAIGALCQLIIFKLLYPYPDFFSDSYKYIYAAYSNSAVSIWPIGYTKFILAFHYLTHYGTALVCFQYFFLELGAVYFFFTILYFFRLVRVNQWILFLFLFFNPLFLYLSNYVNSDPVFIALSLFWFTHLIWIINRPKVSQIFVQATLIFLCFTVRNNAYYYPFVTIMAFLLVKQPIRFKIAGIVTPFLLIVPFIIHTRNEAYKLTGTRQFSLFTGWQLANNALYAFQYDDIPENLSSKSQEVYQLSRQFYTYMPRDFRSGYLSPYVGNFFIRESYSPLKQYMMKHYNPVDEHGYVVAWGKSSAVFSEFGSYFISHNPAAYFFEFVVPNVRNYLLPPLEKLEIYNLGMDNVEGIAQTWFYLDNSRVSSVSKSAQKGILYVFPVLFLVLNFYLLVNMVLFWLFGRHKTVNSEFRKCMLVIGGFYLFNFIFSVSVTIVVFRYEIFPMIVCLPAVLLLSEWVAKKGVEREMTSNARGGNGVDKRSKWLPEF